MTKNDVKKIKEIFLEAFEPFAISIQGDFNRTDNRISEVQNRTDNKISEIQDDISEIKTDIKDIQVRLFHLENRVEAIENILTEHQKELRRHSEELKSIKVTLAKLQKSNGQKFEKKEFILLERRVSSLEAEVAAR